MRTRRDMKEKKKETEHSDAEEHIANEDIDIDLEDPNILTT